MVKPESKRVKKKEDEEGLHADDTSELLFRRNLIVGQSIDQRERKKIMRDNKGKKEDNENNNKRKKEDGEKKEKTN